MKRVLSLDGGGIRGVFSLQVLLRMQQLLRDEYGSNSLVLSDHFDLFAGTSTGAIIATGLCWGMPVEDILNMYVQYGRSMFHPVPWYRPIKKLFVSRFEAKPLSELLQRIFSEDGDGKVPALLGSDRLKKLLLVVVRNNTTGSAWPLTNNPKAKYNQPPDAPDSNLNIPLWKVVRASTAAPVYFDPEEIVLGNQSHIFVDGSVTPYNNPALIAALTSALPCYRLDWPLGPKNIRIISVGTIRFSSQLPPKMRKLWLGQNISRIPIALIQGIAWEQDLLCRCLGDCIYGDQLDSEVDDLICKRPDIPSWFSYVRYNQAYKAAELEKLLQTHPRLAHLDAIDTIPVLGEIGAAYANNSVKLKHLI